MRNQKGYVAGYNGQAVVTADQVIVGAMLSQHTAGRTLLHPLPGQCRDQLAAGRDPPEAAHRARGLRLRQRGELRPRRPGQAAAARAAGQRPRPAGRAPCQEGQAPGPVPRPGGMKRMTGKLQRHPVPGGGHDPQDLVRVRLGVTGHQRVTEHEPRHLSSLGEGIPDGRGVRRRRPPRRGPQEQRRLLAAVPFEREIGLWRHCR